MKDSLMKLTFSKLLSVVICAACGLPLVGCPGGNAPKKAAEPCRELGQQCEFAPGKLGACSYRANCTGTGCLYCQSQH
jgi:hypothetical protein